MDFLISVAGKIAEYAIEPVGRQFGYLIYYNSNIENLKTKVEKLEDVRLRMAGSVAAAERRGDIVFPDVGKWLSSVDQIREESTEFLNNQVNQNQKCFSRQLPCPDLVSRYRVSRKSSKKSLQVDGLLNDRINFGDQVSTPAPPPPARAMFPGDIEAFDSRKSTFEAIMKALEDDEVNMIGVYGMGGIGKTTMVKQVAKEAEKLKLFDEFAMAVVSQKPDVRKIQCEIAEHLELKLDEETESVRAGRLYQRMNQGKRILLVLDDLWDLIDLEKIGIHDITKPKCCKIILTSRNLNVCKKMMKSMHCNPKYFIPIEVLSPTDAFGYFRANAGDAVDSSDLLPIATEIVKKCAGLPIAIKTIGLALTGKRQHDWEDVLEQLRSSTAQNIEGVHQDVYGVLEVSYNLLDSNDLRYCFLICSLFEEDADISKEDLVRYGLGLNLFQTRNRAHVLVDKLKDRSLLMKGKTDNSVTMHDVIRDFAHFLASSGRENVFLVRQGEDITEWLDRDACGHYTAISLLWNQISELPEGLDCPKLKILIFSSSSWSSIKLKIPSNFFQGMKQLRVLKMSKFSMKSITASIALLESLETLCLEYSELEDLSQIGGLKKLKVLSLVRSTFQELPREIGLLTNLMILDLTNCNELKVVPPTLISNLIKLECLYVLNYINQWSWGGSNATVGELKHLDHLNTLEMYVPDINLLPNDLPFQKLVRFRVYIGNCRYKYLYWDLRRDLEKMLVIQLEPDHNNTLPTWVKTLMKRAQALVVKFKGYNYPTEEYPHPSALSDLNEDGFKNLMYLEVEENYSMKYLIDSSNASTPTFFPLLEELLLEKLGLNEICSDDLPNGSFGELRELKLSNLPNLTKLWSMNDSARYPRLVNLRSVQISDCKELKHVFPQSASALLGQLESLTVVDCESLEGIFLEDRPEMDDIIHLPKLQILKIHRVPSLKGQLFDTKILLPALEELDFAGLDQSLYIWLTQLLLESSCILRKINISDCKSIVIVFPSNVQHCLQNLASLSIIGCESLEAILEADITSTSMLPQLQQQHHNLDQLRQPKLPRGFPSLKEINISNCPKMKAFAAAATTSMVDYNAININVADLTPSFFNETIVFPALQKLELSGLHDVKEIWHPRLFSSESFHRLMNVIVRNCNSLVTIFPSSVLRRLKNLEFIEISNCELVEEVFGFDDEDAAATVTVEFSHLQQLTIIDCPKMKTFLAAHKHNIGGDFIQPFFHEKVDLPVLEELYISGVEGVEELWHDRYQVGSLGGLSLIELPKLTELWWNKDGSGKFSCPDLRSLEVVGCHGLRNIFVPSAIKHDMNIQKLTIRDCSNMEEVVGEEEQGEYSGDKLLFRLVEVMSLENLPNLRTFCRGNYILEWPSLSKMVMNDCPNMAKFCLGPVITPLLKGLSINEYNDEVWMEGSNLNDIIQYPYFNKIVFSGWGHLELRDLHDVKELGHPQLFSIEMFCRLKRVNVSNCNSLVTIFPSSVLRRLNNLETIWIENCELVEEVFGFHDEDAATVSVSAMMMMIPLQDIYLNNLPNLVQFGQLGTVEFSHLKELTIMNCPKMKTFLAAHKHNLSGDFIQPFFQEKVDLPVLEELYISGVEGVEELWHDRYQVGSLGGLSLIELPKLTELWWNKDGSGKFSCPDLRSLEVVGCHGLRNIFVPSAIKHDMNIQKLTIRDCSNMEEVVGEEEQGEYSGDKLLFRLVEVMSLENLPNLRTFCRGNYILEWPSLSKMVMNDCPNMEKFCLGPVITPLLKGLSENEYNEEVWMEGSNLNDIIQHPYFNKIVFSGWGRLELRDLHDVKELRELSLIKLFSIEGFRRLTRVKVSNCSSLVTIFPSSVLRRLNNLESICIENCELVEEVFGFHDEDAATVSVSAMMMMIPLQDICLVNLPNLVHFGQLGTVEFSHLEKLTIMDCPKMKTFLAAHKHNLSGDFIQPFFQEKVDLPVLENLCISGVQGVEDLGHDRSQARSLRELYLRELPKLTELWWNKDGSGKFSCPDLQLLEVIDCHSLRNIFVPSAIKHDMNIQKLTIADCSNMEEVVGEEEHGEYSGDKLLFRLVEELSLENLPNLRTFCLGNYILEWPSLSKMVMNNCPNMAKFCLGPVSTPLLKGLSEKGDNKEVLREGSNLNDIIQHLYNQKEIAAKEKQEEETSGTREAHLE